MKRNEINVGIKLIAGGKMPVFKTDGACCLDCYARLEKDEYIKCYGRKGIPLGFALELPDGYEAVIRPRSGLTSEQIDIGIGTIDSDYRGEIKACVINNKEERFTVHDGDRICQLAIREVPHVTFRKVETLTETKRGANGFGSTGLR